MFMSKKSRAKIDLNFLRPSPCTDKKWKSPLDRVAPCGATLSRKIHGFFVFGQPVDLFKEGYVPMMSFDARSLF